MSLLEDLHLDILNYLWDVDGASINQLCEWLEPTRNLSTAYVTGLMKQLEETEQIKREKRSKAWVYIPLLSRSKIRAAKVSLLLSSVFGSLSPVHQAADNSDRSLLDAYRHACDFEDWQDA